MLGQSREEPRSFCENCGSTSAFVLAFAPEHQVQRCRHCGGWSYVGGIAEPAEKIYDRGYFSGGEYADYTASLPAQRRNFLRKLKLMSRAGVAFGPQARLLELGCATGEFLELARELGVGHALGIEVSPYAREVAQGKRLTVLSPDSEELGAALRELAPNIVVAWDVWEHLQRPASTLESYLQTADARAVVALATVDASSGVARLRGTRWRQFHPPTHLHYPTRTSLRQFFAARAMRILLHQSFGYYRPALEYLRALRLDSLVRGREQMQKLPLYLNLWDTQLVVAQRVA